MIRVKAPINEDDEEQDEPFETIEEQGYKIGRKGNQCEIDLTEALKRIDEEEEIALDARCTSLREDLDGVSIPSTPNTAPQLEELGPKVDDMRWKRLTTEGMTMLH